MKRYIVPLLYLCLNVFIHPAFAENVEKNPFSVAYFRDPSGQSSFKDIEKDAAFIPFEGILSKGYDTKAVYWLKILIPSGNPSGQPWILRLQPSWHDDIRLFDPLESDTSFRQAGDLFPWALSEFPSLGHAFVIKENPEPRNVYVRIQSVHSYQINVELLNQMVAERAEWYRILLLSLYLSAMTLIWLWAIFNFWSTREQLLGHFVATQFMAILYSVLAFGVARALLDELISDSALDKAHSSVIIIYTFMAMQFNKLLLDNVGMRRWIAAPVYVISFIPIVSICFYLYGDITRALSINSICLMSFPIATIIAVWFGMKQPGNRQSLLPLWILKLYFTLSLAIGLLGALPLLNLMRATNISSQIFLFHGPLLITILGAFLIFRTRDLDRQQRRKLAVAMTVAEEERKKRIEQNRFMSMLNHEIKIPLGILKLLVAGQSIQDKAERQIDTVVSLLERCLLDDKLSDRKHHFQYSLFGPQTVVAKAVEKLGGPQRFDIAIKSTQALNNDPEIYAILVGNLIDNAIKYSPGHSKIQIALEDRHHHNQLCLCLRVKNEIGRMGAPDPLYIFEKYYRAESARSIPGTGLGLYLVKSFSTALGGDVIYKSSSTHVEFSLCLPH